MEGFHPVVFLCLRKELVIAFHETLLVTTQKPLLKKKP